MRSEATGLYSLSRPEVRNPIRKYAAIMITSLKKKFMRVSLAEWERLSISSNWQTQTAAAPVKISQPANDFGR